MIQPQELRIGNYVKDPYNKVIKLVNVNQDASMLRPITLTEQWLIDFGFKNKYEDENFNPIYVLKGIEIIKQNNKFFLYASFPSIEIKYIHQLQNLYFALTGKELTLIKK